MGAIDKRLGELGITLPKVAAPVANYVPFVRTGNLLIVSGQLCFEPDGPLTAKGQLGAGVSVEQGQKATRASALNCVAVAKLALGDLDKVKRVVRLGGFISSVPGYTDAAKVMNGASDVMVEIFGDAGRHCRTTIGVSSLPLDTTVEVEAMFEVA